MAEHKGTLPSIERKAASGNEAVCEPDLAREKIADLLEWRHKARADKPTPSETVRLRQRIHLFTRREKEAVLLAFLLSDVIRDEQLDAVIQVLIG